jgi:hypothetical protein
VLLMRGIAVVNKRKYELYIYGVQKNIVIRTMIHWLVANKFNFEPTFWVMRFEYLACGQHEGDPFRALILLLKFRTMNSQRKDTVCKGLCTIC